MPADRRHRNPGPGAAALLLRFGLYAAAIGFAVLAGYLLYLDRVISGTFEGRRWSVPARIYAQPLEIYPGLGLSVDEFEVELKRLGYTRTGSLSAPGTFHRDDRVLDVWLRGFAFSDGYRPATRLRLRFASDRILSLDDESDARIPLVRLEPPQIGSFFASHGEDRLIVAPEDTPPLLTETLKVVEDRRFDAHPGFDWMGIARAFWTNLRAGEVRQGGSTLTQQLVKSFFLDNRRTLGRKLKELAMAIILELRFDKTDLLNAYINEIYLGQDGNRAIHGFGLASEFYFNKPITELGAPEIALLVAIIRGPSYYNPYQHLDRARQRRDLVLGLMRDQALIDQPTYEATVSEPPRLSRPARRGGRYYPGFMDLVRRQLADSYDEQLLGSGGYRVFTTLNPRIQEQTESAIRTTLQALEAQRGLPPDELQAAAVVTSTQTGDVLALVGGRRPGFPGFNRALMAKRPVGSLMKPVVYLNAFESGRYHLASQIDDTPFIADPSRPDAWTPHNFDGKYHGRVPLVRALGDSLNVATVRLGLELGVEKTAQRLAELIDRPIPNAYPSLLLGAIDMSPMDMARLYTVFASGGFSARPTSVIEVRDETGALAQHYPITIRKVADASAIAQLNSGLRSVMSNGTGKTSRFRNRGVAGKTGTSDDFRDSWFVGFDNWHLSVIWIGYDDNRPVGLTGAAGAMRVWDELMRSLNPVPLNQSLPPGFIERDVDYATGAWARSDCAATVRIVLPNKVDLPGKPGCGPSLGERVKSWFD